MKRLIVILFVTASMTGLFWAQSPQAADRGPVDVKAFMRAKLVHSKNVLEGLTTENYDLIAKGSQQLTLLSLDTDWQVLRTSEYTWQSLEFRHTSQSLTDAAQKKNLDGATLTFVELTLKCVQCHKYVRSVEMARANDPVNPVLPTGKDSTAKSRQASSVGSLQTIGDLLHRS
ncbi:MAG: hypothetical protein QGG71_18040 [Pirellulaceae bacterium]|jgi:hypothetical protein|nr:hypothetical protein [Pirellulaceae bacterium]